MAPLVSHIFLTLIAVLTAAFAALLHPDRVGSLPPRQGPAIASATIWGYQLQNVRARLIPDAVDLLVVDFQRDGSATLSQSEVAALATRTDGSRRIVLAYMSIGEAESYRWYWQTSWHYWSPAWLGRENPNWKGNFEVRFWHPDWQRIIVDPAPEARSLIDKAILALGLRTPSYIDRIIDAGFDGVYLDRVDAYYTPLDGRASASGDMAAFVAAISRHAKSRKPGFLVVPQNGEELLADPSYVRHIDGISKEDLLFGTAGDGSPNPESDVDASVRLLEAAKAKGKPVFVVEYLTDPAQRIIARERLMSLGYRPAFARRQLSDPPELPTPEAGKRQIPRATSN